MIFLVTGLPLTRIRNSTNVDDKDKMHPIF